MIIFCNNCNFFLKKNKIRVLFTFVVFVLLVVFWRVIKNDNYQDYNPTVIIQTNKFQYQDNKELLKGNKVIAQFRAKNNKLGIISVLFNTHSRINDDYLQFSIKEVGSDKWYYSNNYKVDQFQDNQYFPFGFPEINNSKGKEYQIEIESLGGIEGNSVEAVVKNVPFLSKYSFPKAYLLEHKNKIPLFILDKFGSFFTNISLKDYLIIILISLLFGLYLSLEKIQKMIAKVFYFIKVIFIFIKDGLNKILDKNSIIFFLIILIITIYSRYGISYKKPGNLIVPPESVLWLSPMGRDFYTGAVIPTQNLLEGKNFLDNVASYGSVVSVTLAPFLHNLEKSGVCYSKDIIPCHLFLYKNYLLLFLGLFFIFTVVCFLKIKSKDKSLFLLFISIFVLQVPFAVGIERGNLDLILSVLIGFLFLLSLKTNNKNNLLKSLLIGLLAGYLTNAKIFLLPFSFAAILFSGNIFVSFFSFMFSFVGFSYLPYIYGVNTNVFSVLEAVLLWKKSSDGLFSVPFYLIFNHSIIAISTWFTKCVDSNSCLNKYNLAWYISKFLFLFVFVFPFVSFKFRKNIFKKIKFKKIYKFLLDFLKNLKIIFIFKKRELCILFYIISVAVINLIPASVYTYRLLYSIPILLILIGETKKHSVQRILLLKSVLFFMLNGLWFCFYLSNKWSLLDARFMGFFVILHYYYLIKLGVFKINNEKK